MHRVTSRRLDAAVDERSSVDEDGNGDVD